MLSEFIEALTAADGVLVAPIYRPEGRETKGTEEEKLFLHEVRERILEKFGLAELAPSYPDTIRLLKNNTNQYDVCVIFSAGELDGYLRRFIAKEE